MDMPLQTRADEPAAGRCRAGPRAIDRQARDADVPYAAGGGTDTVSRLIGEHMSRALGRTVIVENVVGGGGTLANDRVARSAPEAPRC